MEIEPTAVDVVRRLRDGRLVLISNDVHNVAADLAAIDPCLHLRYSESAERFVVYEERDGDQHFVLAAPECDQRIVNRVREIARPGYSYADEVERTDREADARIQERFKEQTGEVAEHLYHALRKDGVAPRQVFVPRGVEK